MLPKSYLIYLEENSFYEEFRVQVLRNTNLLRHFLFQERNFYLTRKRIRKTKIHFQIVCLELYFCVSYSFSSQKIVSNTKIRFQTHKHTPTTRPQEVYNDFRKLIRLAVVQTRKTYIEEQLGPLHSLNPSNIIVL